MLLFNVTFLGESSRAITFTSTQTILSYLLFHCLYICSLIKVITSMSGISNMIPPRGNWNYNAHIPSITEIISSTYPLHYLASWIVHSDVICKKAAFCFSGKIKLTTVVVLLTRPIIMVVPLIWFWKRGFHFNIEEERIMATQMTLEKAEHLLATSPEKAIEALEMIGMDCLIISMWEEKWLVSMDLVVEIFLLPNMSLDQIFQPALYNQNLPVQS